MQTLVSFLSERLPGGLSYDDAAQLCLRLYCVSDKGLPAELRPQTGLPELADAFATLAGMGWVRDHQKHHGVIYGAHFHEISDRGHWVEVIASIYKTGEAIDQARGQDLALRAGLVMEAKP